MRGCPICTGFDPICPACGQSGPLFDRRSQESRILGTRGGNTHFHEYTEGLGIGHVKIQTTGEKFSVNNFNREVDNLLPNWMKK